MAPRPVGLPILRRVLSVAAGLAIAAMLAGCAFAKLSRSLDTLERTTILEGHVRPGESTSVVVLLYEADSPSAEPIDWFPTDASGRFLFRVMPGRYRLAAFDDRDGDRVAEPAEPAGRRAAIVVAAPGVERLADLDFPLDGDVASRLQPPPDLHAGLSAPRLARGASFGSFVSVGEVVSLDDPRFAREVGEQGYWSPLDFVQERRAGLYFLEPYDPARIPVLFVHGALGTPRDFARLIPHLDRKRYQAWVLAYPSGLAFGPMSERLAVMLGALRVRLGFERIAVVAHSMGGLLSRAALEEAAAIDGGDDLRALVTLSTPWGGQEAAAFGVARSPVVVPSWRDVAPGSAFLRRLRASPLPPRLRYALFFGFEGHSRFIAGNSDGTVSIASELEPEAQQLAFRMRGFPETHQSILESEAAGDALAEALGDALR